MVSDSCILRICVYRVNSVSCTNEYINHSSRLVLMKILNYSLLYIFFLYLASFLRVVFVYSVTMGGGEDASKEKESFAGDIFMKAPPPHTPQLRNYTTNNVVSVR